MEPCRWGKTKPDSEKIIIKMSWKGEDIVCLATHVGGLGGFLRTQLPETFRYNGKLAILPKEVNIDDDDVPSDAEWFYAFKMKWD